MVNPFNKVTKTPLYRCEVRVLRGSYDGQCHLYIYTYNYINSSLNLKHSCTLGMELKLRNEYLQSMNLLVQCKWVKALE